MHFKQLTTLICNKEEIQWKKALFYMKKKMELA